VWRLSSLSYANL
jgi:hypothetical protein